MFEEYHRNQQELLLALKECEEETTQTIKSAISFTKRVNGKLLKVSIKEVLNLLSKIHEDLRIKFFLHTPNGELITMQMGHHIYAAVTQVETAPLIQAFDEKKTQDPFKDFTILLADQNPWDTRELTKVTFSKPPGLTLEKKRAYYKIFGEVHSITPQSAQDVVVYSGKLKDYLILRWHKHHSKDGSSRNPNFKVTDTGKTTAKICCKTRCHHCGGIHMASVCPPNMRVKVSELKQLDLSTEPLQVVLERTSILQDPPESEESEEDEKNGDDSEYAEKSEEKTTALPKKPPKAKKPLRSSNRLAEKKKAGSEAKVTVGSPLPVTKPAKQRVKKRNKRNF